MKVELSYDEFLAATKGAGVWVFYQYDPDFWAGDKEKPQQGRFVAQAMVKGVTLEYSGDAPPATWGTDFAGISLEVQGIPE